MQNWVQDTDTYEILQTELALFEAMQAFLDRRIGLYLSLGRRALESATGLEQQALDRMRGADRIETEFAIGSEALELIGSGSKSERLWGFVYEDDVAKTLDDTIGLDQVSAILNRTVAEEDRDGFSASRTASIVAKQLRTIAEEVVKQRVFGTAGGSGMTLADALKMEAFYAQMDVETRHRTTADTPAGDDPLGQTVRRIKGQQTTRGAVLAGLRRAFDSPTDERHGAVLGAVRLYVKNRLKAAAALADPLAQIVGKNDKAHPDHRQVIVVVDDEVEKRLMTGLLGDKETWRSLLNKKSQVDADDGDGLQRWDDPNIIFFYTIHGVLPVYRFVGIDSAYDAYNNFMHGGGKYPKPHPLHCDARWEDTLPEVSARHFDNQAAASSGDLTLLAKALSRGIVFRPTQRSHWRLRALGRDDKLGGDDGALFDAFRGWLDSVPMRRAAFVDAVERTALNHELGAEAATRFSALAVAGGPSSALAGKLAENLNLVIQPSKR